MMRLLYWLQSKVKRLQGKVLRMEVPCCSGLEMAAKKALQDSGKAVPLQVVTLSIDGRVL